MENQSKNFHMHASSSIASAAAATTPSGGEQRAPGKRRAPGDNVGHGQIVDDDPEEVSTSRAA